MARVLIMSFSIADYHMAEMSGFFNDPNAGIFQSISVFGIPYDVTLATSIRQQLMDGFVTKFNEVYAGQFPVIMASDIEYMV